VTPLFEIVLLDSRHDRTAFDCASEPLNRYFSQQVSQDVRRRVTACYVALSQDGLIAGFYTLASTALLLSQLPADLGKKLPRYPTVPTVRMGHLAVDQAFKGQGLGGALLADALVVDAKDAAAAAFYRHHGLIALPSQPTTLFLPLATAPTADAASALKTAD